MLYHNQNLTNMPDGPWFKIHCKAQTSMQRVDRTTETQYKRDRTEPYCTDVDNRDVVRGINKHVEISLSLILQQCNEKLWCVM